MFQGDFHTQALPIKEGDLVGITGNGACEWGASFRSCTWSYEAVKGSSGEDVGPPPPPSKREGLRVNVKLKKKGKL